MAGTMRQKVLTLYLTYISALDSRVLGWSIYDGTGKESDSPPATTTSPPMKPAWTR